MESGSLVVVGTGITLVRQATQDAIDHIKNADKVFYLLTDPASMLWIHELNPSSESLHDCYEDNKPRKESYYDMVNRVVSPLDKGVKVCFALYGHPGVFVFPSHEAIRVARDKGYSAKMLPAVSAEDCLFADIGFDPAASGCQSFEATDFLIYHRVFDTSCALILWQIGVIGHIDFQATGYSNKGISVLSEVLMSHYGRSHEVIIYEASMFPFCEPRMEKVSVENLISANITAISTLYVPPLQQSIADKKMMKTLGME